MPVPAGEVALDPPVYQYFFRPQLNGVAYDPDLHGGAITQLVLRRVATSTLVETLGPPVRVSYGVYRFDIPESVEEDIYFGELTWRRTATSPDIVDDSLVVPVPERRESAIKPWITLHELVNYHPDVKGIHADIAMDIIDSATQVLYGLSGRKYRGRRVVQELYGCDSGGRCNFGMGHAMGYSHNRRSHDGVIQLRGRPVQRVLQVSLDTTGAIIPPHLWRLVDGRYIEPTRNGGWSPCQSVRVTYAYGAEPTRLAKQAALGLAGNLALMQQGSDACQLPARVTSVSRQGLSFSVLDPQDFLKDGRTGVYEVDLFLKTVNPDHARMRPRVVTPDGPRARSVASVFSAQYITPYPLFVRFGHGIDLVYSWRPNGSPMRITGVYDIRAQAGTVDLTPYVTVERDGEPGRIDINVPADVAATIPIGSTWYLDAVLVTDSTIVHRLLTGEVRQSI